MFARDIFAEHLAPVRERLGSIKRTASKFIEVFGTDNRRLTWICYASALITGIVFVLSIFPRNMLLSGVVPNMQMNGDTAAHVIGQRAFLQDTWHWPLLKTLRLNAPEGLSIAMTDSNPLVALPLKLFRKWLPTGFSAIQLWLAFACLIQPLAAVFALRSTGERRFIPAVAISLLAEAIPTFLYRHTESSLSSHFVLLLAIASYFRTTRHLPKAQLLPPVLSLASLLIHPYLAFMTLGLLAAAPLTLALRGDQAWLRAATVIALSIVLMAIVASCLGYAAADPPGGFGMISMNAISPFYPYESRLFGRHLMFVDATGAQYEGYQYLGAGLLLLSVICVTTIFFSTRVYFVRLHLGLACACLAFVALALSNTVYVGMHKIVDLEPIPGFMHQLRSSGRVFWPVTYVLLVGCVATTARLIPGRAGSAILMAAALLQVDDAHDLRHREAHDLRAHSPMMIDEARLEALMSTHTRLTVVPSYGCGADANAPEFLQILLAASMHNVVANTMYVGRFGVLPNCTTTETAEAPLATGELRVFLPQMARSGPALVTGSTEGCRALGVVAVCTLQGGTLKDLPAVNPPSLDVGKDLRIGIPLASPVLGSGWYTPESDGVWSVDTSATIVSVLTPPPASDIVLQAQLQGFTGRLGTFQNVQVSINGHKPTAFDIPDRRSYALRLIIPHDQLVTGSQVIRFDIGHPERPSSLGLGGDTRQLGIFLSRLRFSQVVEEAR